MHDIYHSFDVVLPLKSLKSPETGHLAEKLGQDKNKRVIKLRITFNAQSVSMSQNDVVFLTLPM